MRIMNTNGRINLKENWKFIVPLLLIFILAIWKFGIIALSELAFLFSAFVFFFYVILKSNTIALGLIFTMAFSQVIFHGVGLPEMLPTLLTESGVILLLAKSLYLRLFVHNKPLRVVGFYPMLLCLPSVVLISFIFNESEVLPAIFFIRKTFIFYLFFIALLNLDFSEETVNRVNKYIIFLFLIQLPALLIKLIAIGPEEKWVGTVSWQAGQLSTTLPLFAISFLLAFYLFRQKKRFILLIAGFILFGISGQKRALVFFLPILFMVIWYLYDRQRRFRQTFLSVKRIKVGILLVAIAGMALYGGAKFLPDLTYGGDFYEGRTGGAFDIRHIVDYVIWYNTRDYTDIMSTYNTDNTQGRWTITMISLKRLRESGTIRQLVGFGPGVMIESQHIRQKDPIFERFGIRGAYTGFVTFVLQVGFLGVIFLTYFFLKMFRKIYILYQKSSSPDFKMIALGFMGATCLVILDFFFYGTSTLLLNGIPPIYFYVAAVLLRNYQGL